MTGNCSSSSSSSECWTTNGTSSLLPDNGNSTDYPDMPGIETFIEVSSITLTVCSLIGAALNLLVIKFSRRLRTATGDSTHCYVLSMAMADLLLCCFAQPFEFVLSKLNTAGLMALPDWLCRMQHMVYWLGYSASGMSLTLLNVDKLLFFRWPLHYALFGNGNMVYYVIGSCWLGCSLATLSTVVPSVLELSSSGDCATLAVSVELYLFFTICFCILPVCSSAVVSAYLAYLVRRMRRRTQVGDSSSSTLFGEYTVQQRLRAMAFIFITTAWTFLALTPFRIFNLVRLYKRNDWESDPSTLVTVHWLGYVFIDMLSLNPCVSSSLTLITYAPYRKLATKFFLKLRHSLLRLAIALRLAGVLQLTGGLPRSSFDSHTAKYSLTHSEWV